MAQSAQAVARPERRITPEDRPDPHPTASRPPSPNGRRKSEAAFVGLMIRDGALALDLEDEILKASVVTHGGAVVHEGVRG